MRAGAWVWNVYVLKYLIKRQNIDESLFSTMLLKKSHILEHFSTEIHWIHKTAISSI